MTEPQEDHLTILHFDDEIDSVAPIAVSIVNYVSVMTPEWIREEDVVYEDFLRSFRIRPPELPPLLITFKLVESASECQDEIKNLRHNDIALFDLMRENPDGSVEYVGIDLYRSAAQKGMSPDRLFVLTGFPHLLEAHIVVPEEQRLLKPISPSEVAEKVVSLFPSQYRAGGGTIA